MNICNLKNILKGGFVLNIKLFLTKLLYCAIVASLIISADSSVFAESLNNQKNNNASIKMYIESSNPSKNLMIVLNRLVKDGIMTQARADEIVKLIDQRIAKMEDDCKKQGEEHSKPEKKNIIWKLYKTGDITKDEAILIKSKMHELRKENMDSKLNILQQKGILSLDDIKSINDFMNAEREEKRKAIERLKEMSQEEKNQYFQARRNSNKNIIDKMVENKVITEKQAEEIKKIMPEFGNWKNNKH